MVLKSFHIWTNVLNNKSTLDQHKHRDYFKACHGYNWVLDEKDKKLNMQKSASFEWGWNSLLYVQFMANLCVVLGFSRSFYLLNCQCLSCVNNYLFFFLSALCHGLCNVSLQGNPVELDHLWRNFFFFFRLKERDFWRWTKTDICKFVGFSLYWLIGRQTHLLTLVLHSWTFEVLEIKNIKTHTCTRMPSQTRQTHKNDQTWNWCKKMFA